MLLVVVLLTLEAEFVIELAIEENTEAAFEAAVSSSLSVIFGESLENMDDVVSIEAGGGGGRDCSYFWCCSLRR